MRGEKLGQGAGHERKRGSGREGEPEHFVKQGKMRLHRGTTAAFLSLQNYVFRRPPPYLSKHNKFPLCLSCLPPTHPPSNSPPSTHDHYFFLLRSSRLRPTRYHRPSFIFHSSFALSTSPSPLPFPAVCSWISSSHPRTHPRRGVPRLSADPRPSFSYDVESVRTRATATEIEYPAGGEARPWDSSACSSWTPILRFDFLATFYLVNNPFSCPILDWNASMSLPLDWKVLKFPESKSTLGYVCTAVCTAVKFVRLEGVSLGF